MDDLVEALTIMKQYMQTSQEKYPTWCSHDTLHVCASPNDASEEDLLRLNELGFFASDVNGEYEFISFRFGRC
jgi:hypothetical protein